MAARTMRSPELYVVVAVLTLFVTTSVVRGHAGRGLQATLTNASAPSGSLREKARAEDSGGRTVCQFSVQGKHPTARCLGCQQLDGTDLLCLQEASLQAFTLVCYIYNLEYDAENYEVLRSLHYIVWRSLQASEGKTESAHCLCSPTDLPGHCWEPTSRAEGAF